MPKLSHNFGATSTNLSTGNSNTGLTPVRVIDIILDETHPEYSKYGSSNSVGAIKYAYIDRKIDTQDSQALPVAFPISSTIRTLPLKNEIVFITQGPSVEASNVRSTDTSTYYTTIISIWNHPLHNQSPDLNIPDTDLGYNFPNRNDVNPLQPFPGDVLIEGRLGQSIRLGGSIFNKNPFTTQTSNGNPFTLISNGQRNIGNGSDHIVEDINQDDSSIYLTSNHLIPLIQARDKNESLRIKPTKADNYIGKQVFIVADRLTFNAREENIGFYSKGIFHTTSESIGLDAVSSIGLDAKKVHLGKEALRELEPVIKGDALELLLYDLLTLITTIGTSMQSASSLAGGPVINMNLEGPTIVREAARLKSLINPGGQSAIKSKKVYTE